MCVVDGTRFYLLVDMWTYIIVCCLLIKVVCFDLCLEQKPEDSEYCFDLCLEQKPEDSECFLLLHLSLNAGKTPFSWVFYYFIEMLGTDCWKKWISSVHF